MKVEQRIWDPASPVPAAPADLVLVFGSTARLAGVAFERLRAAWPTASRPISR